MLDELVEIGEIRIENVSESDSELDLFLEKLNLPQNKNEKKFIAKIDFSTKEKKITIDCKEELKPTSNKDYVFVGSASAPTLPQWFASSTSLGYFLTEAIPNLVDMEIGGKESEIYQKCSKVLEMYFVKIKDYIEKAPELTDKDKEFLKKEKSESKYEYFLNTEDIEVNQTDKFLDRDLISIYREVINKAKPNDKILKNLRKAYENEFLKAMKNVTDLNSKQIGLYVICIDGKPLTSYDEYIKAVIEYKKQIKKEDKKSSKRKKEIKKEGNICYLCGNDEELSFEGLTKVKFKYFTTDKNIFAAYLDRANYSRNLTLCAKCAEKLKAGDVFLRNNLRTTLGSFSLYVLPTFVFKTTKLTNDYLENLSAGVLKSFNTAKNYEALDDLKSAVSNFLTLFDENHYFLLNLIFFKEINAGTKIIKFIPDINPSIFDKIYNAISESSKIYSDLIGNDRFFKITLESIYYSIPIRLKTKNETTEAQKLLNIYDAIFSGKRIHRKSLIKNFVDAIGVVAYKKDKYNISFEVGREMSNLILRQVFVSKFLEILGCLEVESPMDATKLDLPEDMKNYIQKMNYSEDKTALFLLGVLIGEIGAKQYQNIKERQGTNDAHKPILNKLNYNGIDRPKLIRLCSDVHNKLRQEKLLTYNTELIFAQMKSLLDKHIDSWKLDKYETLFYILSGYAYKTQKIMLTASNN